MNKINFSKFFHENKKATVLISIALILLSIFWIAPTLKLFYWNFSHSTVGSLGLQLQTMAIFSVVAFPAFSFILCNLVSLYRPLKPQEEGGLLSDTIEMIWAGRIWFLVSFSFLALPSMFTGSLKFNADYLVGFVATINILLFMGTATGIAMTTYSLSREFNPKKLPIEKLGSLPT